jgi:molybdopterin converting factor small subunit
VQTGYSRGQILASDIEGVIVKVALVPRFEQLMAIVNADGQVDPEKICASYLPGLYAPWPDARARGFVEVDVEGDTLRALLAEVGARYKQAEVDFEPICPITNGLKSDFDVFVNGKNHILLAHGLEEKLKDGDEINIQSDTLGHC